MHDTGGNAYSRRDTVESDSRTNRDIGDAVQRRDANSECSTNRADHGTA